MEYTLSKDFILERIYRALPSCLLSSAHAQVPCALLLLYLLLCSVLSRSSPRNSLSTEVDYWAEAFVLSPPDDKLGILPDPDHMAIAGISTLQHDTFFLSVFK